MLPKRSLQFLVAVIVHHGTGQVPALVQRAGAGTGVIVVDASGDHVATCVHAGAGVITTIAAVQCQWWWLRCSMCTGALVVIIDASGGGGGGDGHAAACMHA